MGSGPEPDTSSSVAEGIGDVSTVSDEGQSRPWKGNGMTDLDAKTTAQLLQYPRADPTTLGTHQNHPPSLEPMLTEGGCGPWTPEPRKAQTILTPCSVLSPLGRSRVTIQNHRQGFVGRHGE